MTEVLLFHHALGQTRGFLAFADELRSAGHAVHTPNLYGGKTFVELGDGVGYAEQVGFDVIVQRGAAAADGMPAEIVYAGFSLGALPAQMLAQTRPGARGAAPARVRADLGVRGSLAGRRSSPDPRDGW